MASRSMTTESKANPFAPPAIGGSRPTDPFELFRSRLSEHGCDPQPKSNGGLLTRCSNPAHDDRNPSVTVDRGDDGRVLLHCHRGCTNDDICAGLGLTLADLFPRNGNGNSLPPLTTAKDVAPPPAEEEVSAAHAALREDPDTLANLIIQRKWSLATIMRMQLGLGDNGSVVIPFRAIGGELLASERYVPPWIRGNGLKMIAAGGGRQRQLLLPPGGVPDDGAVFIVEGFNDAIAALSAGVPTIGAPSATWSERFTETLRAADVHCAYVIGDCDAPGRTFAQKAAESLRRAGIDARAIDLDPSRSDGYDVTNLLLEHDHKRGREILEQLTSETEPPDGLTDWPPLVLGGGELPVFPVDALPPPVASFVSAVAEHTQTPADLAAMAALGALSAVALGAAIVDCGGWEEELGLYSLVALPPAERKSTVLRVVGAPARQLERGKQEAAAPRLRRAKARQATLEARAKALLKRIGDGDDSSAEEQLVQVEEELDNLGPLDLPRMFAEDATPEAVGALLARHGSMSIFSAESAFLDNLLGRYGDGSPNLHIPCSAYVGEPVWIDRRGSEPQRIDRPLLSTTLIAQPHVLRKLLTHDVARSQGLVARFSFVEPQTMLGRRRIDTARVPRDVEEGWSATIERVARAGSGGDSADNDAKAPSGAAAAFTRATIVSTVSVSPVRRITLAPVAHELLTDLQRKIEPRLGPDGDLHALADSAARHHGRVARIAGLLHLCEHPASAPIGEQTMHAALDIGGYLLAHAVAAFSAPDQFTQAAIRWLGQRGEQTITQRELHRKLLSHGSAADAQRLAESLEDLGVLRKLPGEHPTSRSFEVHPDVVKGAQAGV
jgi:hypothetical protein